MTLRLGVIGAGGIGTLHAETALRVGLSIAAVCDADLGRAKRLAERCAGARPTDDVAGMLADETIEAVVIAVPNVHHAMLAMQSLKAGKHVLLEKPMAISVAECDAIIEAHRAANRVLQIGFVSRCAPAARAALQFVREGRLGKIYHAKAAMYRRRGIPGLGRWFTTKSESGGGVLIDLGVHLIDIVLHVTQATNMKRAFGIASSTHGSPIANYHMTDMWAGPPNPHGAFDVEDAVTAIIQNDDVTFEINAMWAGDFPHGALRDGIVLLGDKGGCHIDLWANKVSMAVELGGHMCDLSPELAKADPWREAWEGQWRLFCDAVTKGTPPNADALAGRRVQTIIDAIYRSCASGQVESIE